MFTGGVLEVVLMSADFVEMLRNFLFMYICLGYFSYLPASGWNSFLSEQSLT